MKPKRGDAPENWSWEELLALFTLAPQLLSSSTQRARQLRKRLQDLLATENENDSSDAKAVLALKVFLLCPQILELKPRAGFEWLSEQMGSLWKSMLWPQRLGYGNRISRRI